MTSRIIVDADGVQWEAWEVHPTLADRRRSTVSASPVGVERRKRRSARSPLPGNLQTGWLAFRSSTERRRVAPVPDGWEVMSDEKLRTLVSNAVRAGRPRRLMD